MAKNIVILSDGTGQGASMPRAERSNVWKLWDATKRAAIQQVTFYDEGLGAEHKAEWWRWAYDLASRATGLGISQNIKDCYTALIEYYDSGDRVFLFGFSRVPTRYGVSAVYCRCAAFRNGMRRETVLATV